MTAEGQQQGKHKQTKVDENKMLFWYPGAYLAEFFLFLYCKQNFWFVILMGVSVRLDP
jgi:hypothetical protein